MDGAIKHFHVKHLNRSSDRRFNQHHRWEIWMVHHSCRSMYLTIAIMIKNDFHLCIDVQHLRFRHVQILNLLRIKSCHSIDLAVISSTDWYLSLQSFIALVHFSSGLFKELHLLFHCFLTCDEQFSWWLFLCNWTNIVIDLDSDLFIIFLFFSFVSNWMNQCEWFDWFFSFQISFHWFL